MFCGLLYFSLINYQSHIRHYIVLLKKCQLCFLLNTKNRLKQRVHDTLSRFCPDGFFILKLFYSLFIVFILTQSTFLSCSAIDNRTISTTDTSSDLLLCLTSPTEDLHHDGQSDHKQQSACRSDDAGQAS